MNGKDEFESLNRTKSKKTDTKREETKQVDLENIQIYLEPPEITEVRKKKEEEWKKKEDDVKKKILKDKERQEETNEYIKKQKDFEKKNVTADSNGCPILIKGISYNLVNDFILAKHGVNEKEKLAIVLKTEKSEGKEAKKEEKIVIAAALVNTSKEATPAVKKEEKKKQGPILDKVSVKAEVKDIPKKIAVFNDYNIPKQTVLPMTQPAGSNYEYKSN